MVFAEKFSVMSNDKVPTFHDVTERVRQIVEQSGIQTGTCLLYTSTSRGTVPVMYISGESAWVM